MSARNIIFHSKITKKKKKFEEQENPCQRLVVSQYSF